MSPSKRTQPSTNTRASENTQSLEPSGTEPTLESIADAGRKPKGKPNASRRGAPAGKLPRPIRKYERYWDEINRYIDEHIRNKWIKRAMKAVAILVLISSASLAVLNFYPKTVQATILNSIEHSIGDAVILCGGPPRVLILKSPIVDDFHDPKPDSWVDAADWHLTKTAGSRKTDRMVISGTQVGRWKEASPLQDIYEFHESFSIYIEDPDIQKSADWVVRIEPSWLGLSYYRFSMKFPPKDEAIAKVTMTLIRPLHLPKVIVADELVNIGRVRGKNDVLKIRIDGVDSTFTVHFNYIFMGDEPDFENDTAGTDNPVSFPDPSATLLWGTSGFVAPTDGSPESIQDFCFGSQTDSCPVVSSVNPQH